MKIVLDLCFWFLWVRWPTENKNRKKVGFHAINNVYIGICVYVPQVYTMLFPEGDFHKDLSKGSLGRVAIIYLELLGFRFQPPR